MDAAELIGCLIGPNHSNSLAKEALALALDASLGLKIGHEPFPLRRGRVYYFFGPDGYCLPNAFAYGWPFDL